MKGWERSSHPCDGFCCTFEMIVLCSLTVPHAICQGCEAFLALRVYPEYIWNPELLPGGTRGVRTVVVGKFDAANSAVRRRIQDVERRGRGGDLYNTFLSCSTVRCSCIVQYT